MTETPLWTYDSSIDPTDYAGFTYEITNLKTGKRYIGRKYIHKTKGSRVVGESDWRKYWGSCKELLADIKTHGTAAFKREILAFHATRVQTNYQEVKLQFERDVLTATFPDGTPAYYNSNILGKYFRASITATPKTPPKLPPKCRNGHLLATKGSKCRACVALKSSKNRYRDK